MHRTCFSLECMMLVTLPPTNRGWVVSTARRYLTTVVENP